MFFAPTQAEKRIKEWGAPNFQHRLGGVWLKFIEFVGTWMNVEVDLGPDAVGRVYQDVLAGKFNPKAGYILSLWDE